MSKHSNSKYSAFTLIELLVVIAIISILAAILFPVFGRVRENGRKTACASNLKQIGLSVRMYLQDYDSVFMPYMQGPTTSPRALLEPYNKSRQIWVCPSEQDPKVTQISDDAQYVSYMLNNQMATTAPKPATATTPYVAPVLRVVSLIKFPDQIVVTHDSDTGELGWTEGNSWDAGKTTDWPQYRPNGCTDSNAKKTVKPCGQSSYLDSWFVRHNGTFNVLYVDGHVKSGIAQQFSDTNFVP